MQSRREQADDRIQDENATEREGNERGVRASEKANSERRADRDSDEQDREARGDCDWVRAGHELPGVRCKRRDDDQRRSFHRRHRQTQQTRATVGNPMPNTPFTHPPQNRLSATNSTVEVTQAILNARTSPDRRNPRTHASRTPYTRSATRRSGNKNAKNATGATECTRTHCPRIVRHRAPRDARPDLQGIWVAYNRTPLARPDSLTDLYITIEQAREIEARGNARERDMSIPNEKLEYFDERRVRSSAASCAAPSSSTRGRKNSCSLTERSSITVESRRHDGPWRPRSGERRLFSHMFRRAPSSS